MQKLDRLLLVLLGSLFGFSKQNIISMNGSKLFFTVLIAGMLGGMITLCGVLFLQPSFVADQNLSSPATEFQSQAVNYRLNASSRSTAAPFDFKMAAQTAMPVVVHINAVESADAARKRRENNQQEDNPLRDFFGEDFSFENPFGGRSPQRRGSGSGVIISPDGYIVTNNHVVEFADQVEVTLFDNRTFTAQVIGTDPETDIGVIKIDAGDLPVLPYADSDGAEIGEWVLAVGNPFDLTSTVTAGIISAKGRNINVISGNRSIESFIQTDAAVNPGNSGGALVDANGRLLGINTAIATQTGTFSGYSFAIPINMVDKIVNDIIEYGSFQRAFLGINIMDMDSDLADELGLEITQGVYIQQLVDGGAAQYAGLLPKDVITEVNGRMVRTVPELQEIVGRASVGDTIDVKVVRDGKTKSIPVKLRAG